VTHTQIIWLQSDATHFAAPCDACRTERRWIEISPAVVEGSLRLDADVGFATCWRGHRIRVRRIARSPLTAA
jgi:hypothetical protein